LRTDTGIVVDKITFGKVNKFGCVWQWTSPNLIMFSDVAWSRCLSMR